ncbi:MAG: Gx transporter family protein [Magnetococcales bacterium]|nr:Gx transporter family protein [Magnetococcales bacterium]NGZ26625.1 Gx transporter family protein [Magnetococcales bacterium]
MTPFPVSTTTGKDLAVAMLAAASVAVHLLEAALPSLGPWFKPGLANIFTLVALLTLGWRAALAVSLLRVVVASLLLGTLFSPTFFFSLAGALGAVAMLALTSRSSLGVVGLSTLASLAHMTAQVAMGQWLFFSNAALFSALPWFLIGAWLTGVVNGLLAFVILEKLTTSSWSWQS